MRRPSLELVFARWRVLVAVLFAVVALASPRAARADAGQAVTVDAGVAVVASAASAASSPARPATEVPAEVRVRDRLVFTFRAARGGRTPADRAKAAQATLESLLAHSSDLGEVYFKATPETALVFVGETPVLTLGAEDAAAAGEPSLDVLATQATARLSVTISSEKKRSAIATTVFSVSLLVFSALIAFWLLGRAAVVAARLRSWMIENPERVAAIRLGNVELVSAGAARGGSSIALTLGYRLTQIAIGYAWLIFGLSLFESTRGYTEKLTGVMLAPLSAMAARVGSSLPVLFVFGVAVLAVSVLVRFVGLFFDSVERGETRVVWLSRDLAAPTSAIVRFGVVVTALVVASPLITGEVDGALSRVGFVALGAVALASTPLLASALVGAVMIYSRRLRRGELVDFGGRSGRITEIRLLHVRLDDPGAGDVRVPQLLGLFHPTRVHRHPPLTSIDVVVDSGAPQGEVEAALLAAARSISSRGRVELLHFDGGGAHWRVHSAPQKGDATLGRAVQEALANLGVGLGRGSRRSEGTDGT